MTTVNRWTGRETRSLRHALRLTVRAFAEDLGVSPRTVSKWESGGATHVPRPELQAALDTLLRRASADDQARFAEALARTADVAVAPAPRGVPTFPKPAHDASASDAHHVVGQSASQAAAFAGWWETTSAGPVSVDILFSELRRLAADYLDGPPEPVVLGLRDVRDGIFELLRRHQPPDLARELHLAAGYACVLLGWLSGDLGHLGAAGTHARAGSLFVETSRSAELQAWVQAVHSKTSFWLGDYETAARQAIEAFDHAPATGVRVLLAAQAADAWATLGADAPARAALANAADARDAVSDGDVIGGLLSCTPARQANYVSGVQQQLGAPDEAVATADEALVLSRSQPVRSYATEAQIHLNRVDVFLELGDVEASAGALQPVLQLPANRRLQTLTRRVTQIGDTLAAPRFAGNSLAASLSEQAADFALTSVAAAT
jgi:DNA-binding transcriptional regulator YiaG